MSSAGRGGVCVCPFPGFRVQHGPLTHLLPPPTLPEPSKTMVTELWLAPEEFQTSAVTPGSRITFCLKEFRVRPCLPPTPTPGHPSAPLNLPFVPRGC